jgi:hypothetical protein
MPVTAVRWMWDRLFGPPRVRTLPDGSVRVRLLGRIHEGSDYGALFDSVSRERERLIQAVVKTREGSLPKPYMSLSRIGPGEMYHRDIQRLEDRLAIYNDFLGHLVREMRAS